MKKRKVLLLFDSPYATARGYDFKKELADIDWTTEEDVYKALCVQGYDVRMLGLYNDINILLEEVKENRPDIIFNMCEVFNQQSHLDKNVVFYFLVTSSRWLLRYAPRSSSRQGEIVKFTCSPLW